MPQKIRLCRYINEHQHEGARTLSRRAMEQGASVGRMKTTKILTQRRIVRDRIADI
jgi:hypothetical protein